MKKHRIAMVGTGGIAGVHMRGIQGGLADRLECVAAVDIDEDRVKNFCAEYNVPKWYTNVTDMLEAEQPDFVDVATPPASHKTISIECLEAGAWVLCEKPLCASLADFDEIQAAEKRTGHSVSTVFQWRFGSAGKHLKQLIEREAFGKPLVGVCDTLWFRTQEYYDVVWRGKFETEFGGPTVGHGIHLTDLFLWLMGDWQEVQAMMGTLDRNIEVEDVAIANVRFKNGALGSIINSVLSPRQESHLRLDFQKATVEVVALYHYTNEHWKISLPPDVEDDETLALWNDLATDISSSHEQQIRDILDCIDNNQPLPVSGDEARRIIEFSASLYKSASTGKPVSKGEITPDDPFYSTNNGAAAGGK